MIGAAQKKISEWCYTAAIQPDKEETKICFKTKAKHNKYLFITAQQAEIQEFVRAYV